MGFKFVNPIDGFQTVNKGLCASTIYNKCGSKLTSKNEVIKSNLVAFYGKIVDSELLRRKACMR